MRKAPKIGAKAPRPIIPAAMRAPAPAPASGPPSTPTSTTAAPPAGLVLPPWAQQYVDTLDAQKANAQGYIAGTVMPWLSGANANLANANQAAQAGYANALNLSQGLSNVAAGVQTPTVTTGGASSYDPNSYISQAQSRLSGALGAAQFAQGTQQAAYRTAVPFNLATAANASLANYAGTIGPKYDLQKADYLAKVGQFIADQNEQRRQFAIQRNDQERQRRFDRQLSTLNYGVAALKAEAAATTADARANPAPKGLAGPDSGPAPPGSQWVQRADGGWDLKPDKSYVAPGTGPGSKPDTRLDPVALQKGHYIKWQGKGVPNNASGRFVKGNDGNWWLSPAPGTTSGKPPKGRDPGVLGKDLQKLWNGTQQLGSLQGDGWKELGLASALNHLSSWALSVKQNFRLPSGQVDWVTLDNVIGAAIGGSIPQRLNDYWRAHKLGPYAGGGGATPTTPKKPAPKKPAVPKIVYP